MNEAEYRVAKKSPPYELPPAIFIDRDGVINENNDSKEGGPWYIFDFEKEWEWIDGVFEAFRILADMNYEVVVISNCGQCIGEGLALTWGVSQVLLAMKKNILEQGGRIDGIFYCPHHPDSRCYCRKPMPGLFYQASCELNIDLGNSWMIGDSLDDMEAAKAADIFNLILVGNKIKKSAFNYIRAPNLLGAVQYIKSL